MSDRKPGIGNFFKWPVFELDPNDSNTTVFTVSKDRDKEPGTISGFDMSPSDTLLINDWLADHNKTCKFYDDGSTASNPCGAIGGRLTYSFTPTGLGTVVVVMCACGAKLDLTDVDNW